VVVQRTRISMVRTHSRPTFLLRTAAAFLSAILLTVLAAPANAVPALQIYIQGAIYDSVDETWVATASVFSPIRLWIVGNVDGPGGTGELYDVRAAFSYGSDAGNVSLEITPVTTGGYGGFYDPSTPTGPTLLGTHTDGSRPTLANGKSLAFHGEYGAATYWQEWALGDFDLVDSPIADFINSFPEAPLDPMGQINAYDIAVGGLAPGAAVNVDVYGYYLTDADKVKAVFAPFSHDGAFSQIPFNPNPTTDPGPPAGVPAPGAGFLLAGATLWLATRRRRA
jgi:hypothetical protein